MTEQQAMRMALEALEYQGPSWPESRSKAATALRQALEQQDGDCQQCGGKGCVACDARKQQPADKSSLFDNGVYVGSHIGKEVEHTSLDHQPWVRLTDEEIDSTEFKALASGPIASFREYGRTIEAKLKEKNT